MGEGNVMWPRRLAKNWLSLKAHPHGPHLDVGSSVLTMSVLSAYLPTIFLDYRPLNVRLTGLMAVAGDVTCLPFATPSRSSISCLHVIEHIGLGRYGDPINPRGSRKAAEELGRILTPHGRLYLSAPVGRERVCFNAHRVFAPATIPALLPSLRLVELSYVDDAGMFHEGAALNDVVINE
jgi:hypothetical protein